MFSNLSGIIAIAIDALVVIIVVIGLLLGAKKGFIRLMAGFLTIIVVIFGSFALSPLVANLLSSKTTLDDKLSQTVETPLLKYISNPYAAIFYFDEDSDESTPGVLYYSIDGEQHPYSELSTGVIPSSVFKPFVVTELKTADSVYLINAVTISIAKLIILAASSIVLLIVLRVLIWLFIAIFKKLASSLYIMHLLDKVSGLLAGAGLGFLLILVITTILQLLQKYTFMDPVNIILEKTYITKFIADQELLFKLYYYVKDLIF